MGFNVTIDGPAGAGKSTIAKLVAKEKGFVYVDTGAMYRAIALYLIRKGIGPDDNAGFEKYCTEANVSIKYEDGTQVVLLNGENVNGLIRTQEVGNMASASSTNGKVRAQLLELQRKLASENDVVMDGRDIGTNILPNAECKIYLTASSRVRAERRYLELKEKGEECDLDTIEKEIIERDERDMNREIAPLKQAEDAVFLDTSDMSIEEVKGKIVEIIDSCSNK
ncbi:MAG: (d)CMP kinase [Lachnospiraceae bacterium]|nr:(d)CMP kinase [Lachnospiraceae bacterium]